MSVTSKTERPTFSEFVKDIRPGPKWRAFFYYAQDERVTITVPWISNPNPPKALPMTADRSVTHCIVVPPVGSEAACLSDYFLSQAIHNPSDPCDKRLGRRIAWRRMMEKLPRPYAKLAHEALKATGCRL